MANNLVNINRLSIKELKKIFIDMGIKGRANKRLPELVEILHSKGITHVNIPRPIIPLPLGERKNLSILNSDILNFIADHLNIYDFLSLRFVSVELRRLIFSSREEK
jgi:hypothetical protein